jgi:hypothetical protein
MPCPFPFYPDFAGMMRRCHNQSTLLVCLRPGFNAKAQRSRGAKAEPEIEFRKTKLQFHDRLRRQPTPAILRVFALKISKAGRIVPEQERKRPQKMAADVNFHVWLEARFRLA